MARPHMAASELAIEVHGLRKRFGETLALDGLDLAVPTGRVYAVLGPNGAGKTTTIRILATLVRPDAGVARVMGLDVTSEAAAVRRLIGLTGQFASVDAELTGRENLGLLGALLGLSGKRLRGRVQDLLGGFGLADSADRLVSTYSGGQRRRLDLAASIIVAPALLFLDEPTTGLDPRSRYQVWEIVRELVRSGTTVLLTTQYLDEADQLADRIGVIHLGRLVAEGTPGELKASLGTNVLEVRLLRAAQRAEAARLLAASLGSTVEVDDDPFVLRAAADAARAGGAVTDLVRGRVEVASFALGQPSLDDVFLSLTEGGAPGDRTETAA